MKRTLCVLLAVTLMLTGFVCLRSSAAAASDADSGQPFADSRYYVCGDYALHYRVVPAEGERIGRILMVHGFLCSTYAWRNMASEMASRGYECVLVDLPDFGYSTRETADMSIIPREELLVSLMRSIAPTEDWILAGHSMGGGVCINIAAEHPVRALLLYCHCPQDAFPAFATGIVTSKAMETFMDLFFTYGTRCDPVVRLVILAATNDRDFTRQYDLSGVTDPVQHDHFGAGMCEMMYNVLPTRLEDAGSVRCPVLLCQADHDVILNSALKKRVGDAFPGAETYTVVGGGHQCIENRAAELAGVTVAFLDS